jgi:succinate-semialdehyde dehydrogenase/glutarate-semialdehyde dehydrogenase
MTYQSLNPFNGKLIEFFADLGDPQLETKIATADACFQRWRHTCYADRAKIIAKAGEIVHARTDKFARMMTTEMGSRQPDNRTGGHVTSTWTYQATIKLFSTEFAPRAAQAVAPAV